MQGQHPSQDAKNVSRKQRVIVVAASLLVLAFCLTAVMRTEGFRRAVSYKPEHFTELSFSNPEQLPPHVDPGGRVPVSFTVHNLEASDMVYDYRIDFMDTGGSMELAEQEVKVPRNQTRTVTQTITIPNGDSRGKISVTLVGKQQSIHFWTERNL